jgi:hypothetical protein
MYLVGKRKVSNTQNTDYTKIKRGNKMFTEMLVRAFMSDEEKEQIRKNKEKNKYVFGSDSSRKKPKPKPSLKPGAAAGAAAGATNYKNVQDLDKKFSRGGYVSGGKKKGKK